MMEGDGQHSAALAGDSGAGVVDFSLGSSDDDDRSACLGKADRRSFAYPGTGAGDERDFACQFHDGVPPGSALAANPG